MSHLFGIPIPSAEQVIVGSELVFILLPVRILANKVNDELRRERNQIISRHVLGGHSTLLWRCLEGSCPKLSKSQGSPRLDLQPGVEPATELVD